MKVLSKVANPYNVQLPYFFLHSSTLVVCNTLHNPLIFNLLPIFAESPVPLEFTPVLGILIGVVVTLMLVAIVIILILRMKYKSSQNKHDRENR